MPIPARLSRKLQDSLGAEAAEDLVTRIGETDSIRGHVAELDHKMELGFARMEARFGRVDARFEHLDGKLDQLRADMVAVIEKRTANLLKWSFLFWVGAVGAIAALAGVLR